MRLQILRGHVARALASAKELNTVSGRLDKFATENGILKHGGPEPLALDSVLANETYEPP